MYVYLLSSNGLTKIGRTDNIKRRMRSLQLPSEPLGTWWRVQNSQAIERQLHTHFAAKRVRGEWFRLDQEDLDTADDLVAEHALRICTVHLHCAQAV